MPAFLIVLYSICFVIYLISGYVCGRICVDIIRKKDSDMNEVMWFWAGFFLNFIAVFMTLVVKENKKND